jgi:probable F420-dependent oxidoreductase
VEFGLITFPTHDAVPPTALAKLVEERGFRSLFFSDHTHIPASRETPYPGGEELPRCYVHTYDVFAAVTAAIVGTSSLRVGTGVCVVAERDPIITAKQVASIDAMSGGRFDFGVGAGWNREEMRNHGTDPRTRMHLMQERVDSMKAIWTNDVASYHGSYVDFAEIWSYPKPVQKPHPPVLVGGNGPTVEERVLAFGDGWIPSYEPDDSLIRRAEELRARAWRPLLTAVAEVPADPKVLERYERAGFTRALFLLPPSALGPVERALDRIEAAMAEFQGT